MVNKESTEQKFDMFCTFFWDSDIIRDRKMFFPENAIEYFVSY